MSFMPRKPGSLSWTAFPEEFTGKIKEVFSQTYLKNTSKQSFIIEGRIYEAEILLRVGLLTTGKLVQDNFEASIDFRIAEDKAQDRIHLCVDAIGKCFDDFFEVQNSQDEDDSEEEDLQSTSYSRDWEEVDLDGDLLYLRYSSENTLLEQEADRMLGILDESLFKEAQEPEDALQRAEVDTDAAKARQKEIRSGKNLH